MPGNKDLHKAKDAKKDEFYTTRQDIEAELCHYESYFEGKTVYCNCDDPVSSEFWQFFRRNFKAYKLKRLIATHYEPDDKNYAYFLDLSEDTNGDGVVDWNNEPVVTQLPCNGDFRSQACIDLLKQADVVVTNPPFSLWREYLAQLMEYKKDFIIIGNVNAVTYKEVFPYIMQNRLWMGVSIHSGDRKFYVPDNYPLNAAGCGVDEDGRRFIRVKGVRWFTNIDTVQRHECLDLRGNYYTAENYPRYDNYDAIEVSKTNDIPCDYSEVMGVPITFLDHYSPDQFEILGITLGNTVDYPMTRIYSNAIQHNKNGSTQGGSKVNTRASIVVSDKPANTVYYTADATEGYILSIYPRILIQNKHPEPRRYPDED